MPPELVYLSQGQWITFPLRGDEVTLGRDAHNDVVVADRAVSRRHARLQREPDGWRVVDLGSRYGTRVNDSEPDERTLRDGDTIYLHRFALTFVDREAPGATLTSPSHAPAPLTTVYHDAVDFHSLVAGSHDAGRLQRLLGVVTRASELVLVSPSIDDTFGQVLDLVFESLPVERGFVMLWDEVGQEFATRCVRQSGPGNPSIRFSRTIAEKVVRERVAVLTTDAQTDGRFAEGASIIELGIRSAMAAPLYRGDRVEGLIYVDSTLQARAFDRSDLELLSALGSHLAVAIEQARLQSSILRQKLLRRRLERYHSPAVVKRITGTGGSAPELEAEEREVTVLFADVVGFTDRCERLEPREVAALLNHFFGEMAEVVFRHEGTLDKFIGDCLMAVFGAPIAAPDHAERAARAALDMREALAILNRPMPEHERVVFRVGMHSGRVVAGDIGSASRSDYTVLGATVNLAARLESAVARPGQIVLSEATRRLLGDRFGTRDIGEHRPKGISRSIRCHELLDLRSG